MKRSTVLAGLLVSAIFCRAAIKTEVVEYEDGKTVLQGYLAYDDSQMGKRPGVIIVHEWWGHNAYVRKRAEEAAALGYVAFALDMYGKGVVTKDFKEAGHLSGIYKGDRNLMRSRALAGLIILRKNSRVDSSKIAAFGYCFGGTTVLEMARAGFPLLGVASFHGGFDFPGNDDNKNIKGKVLILHGAEDPYATPAQVTAFTQELTKAGVNWEVNFYSGASHSFTNPEYGTDNSKGLAYNAQADVRSWEALKDFLAEVFK